MKSYSEIFICIALLIAVSSVTGCDTIKKAADTVSNLKNIQFKLGSADNFTLNGINISKVRSASDIGVGDALKLTSAFANKTMPISFNLNVLASNPNAKTNSIAKPVDALITRIEWILLIDDKETVNGTITSPITIPANTQTSVIPISIGLDLYKFFGNNGYANLINLAMAIGGIDGSTTRLKLKMRPTISISGINIPYPNYMTVIDKEFRSK